MDQANTSSLPLIAPVSSPDLMPEKVSREVARVAAKWLVQLGSEDASVQDELDCKQWRDANPEHELAWSRAQKLKANFDVLPVDLGMKVLNRPLRLERRKLIKSLAILITTIPATYTIYKTQPWQTWSADYSTAKGERLEFSLPDGSQITLNTDSLLDMQFNQQQRLLVLNQGEIMIETGADANSPSGVPRPFVVQTTQGQLLPIGTKFIVRQYDNTQQTRLSVLDGSVEIYPQSSNNVQRVNSGEQAFFTTEQIQPVTPLPLQADAWANGVLMAQDLRLDDFIKELSRYRTGVLRLDPAVSSLNISGAFQLDNTDQILASLPAILPVSLHYLSPYWVTIRAQ